MNYGNTELQKVIKFLKTCGWTFRLASLDEKREYARKYKKSHKGKYANKENADVYFNFKKEIFACFYIGNFRRFCSRRHILKMARLSYEKVRSDPDNLIIFKHISKFEKKKFREDCCFEEICK